AGGDASWDGVGGGSVDVGATSADVGAGAGPGTTDVGAGAGPGERNARVRPRHVHRHHRGGPRLGPAIAADCPPPPAIPVNVPPPGPNLLGLTTAQLRYIAAQNGIGVG